MNDHVLTESERSRLFQAARRVLPRAYAPYSQIRVGAAVLTAGGQIFSGCNVENVSYGLTLCAERVAVGAAVAGEGGENVKIRAVAVVSDHPGPFAPCGACRQVILEFGQEAQILYQGQQGLEEASLHHLLPEGFQLG